MITFAAFSNSSEAASTTIPVAAWLIPENEMRPMSMLSAKDPSTDKGDCVKTLKWKHSFFVIECIGEAVTVVGT